MRYKKKAPNTFTGRALRTLVCLDGSNQRMSKDKDFPLENQAVQPGSATGAGCYANHVWGDSLCDVPGEARHAIEPSQLGNRGSGSVWAGSWPSSGGSIPSALSSHSSLGTQAVMGCLMRQCEKIGMEFLRAPFRVFLADKGGLWRNGKANRRVSRFNPGYPSRTVSPSSPIGQHSPALVRPFHPAPRRSVFGWMTRQCDPRVHARYRVNGVANAPRVAVLAKVPRIAVAMSTARHCRKMCSCHPPKHRLTKGGPRGRRI